MHNIDKKSIQIIIKGEFAEITYKNTLLLLNISQVDKLEICKTNLRLTNVIKMVYQLYGVPNSDKELVHFINLYSNLHIHTNKKLKIG